MARERERVVELDFVRVVSMLSVILLHTSSGYLFWETKASLFGASFAFILNQGVRYCVPLFFLVSGLSLELSYRNQTYGSFLRRRLNKILLPYLFWTALYYLDGLQDFSPGGMVEAFLWGRAAPQLYFIVALVQLYLLYIPLRRILEEKPVLLLGATFFISFFVQWGAYLMLYQVYILPGELRPYLLKTCFPWLFCFSLGILLAQKRATWIPIVKRYQWPILAVSILFSIFYITDSKVTGSYDLSVKPLLFVYVPLVFFALYSIGRQASKLPGMIWGIHFLSRHSMTVFFCHIFVLQFLQEHFVLDGTSGMLLLCVLTITLSLLFSLVVSRIMRKMVCSL